MTTGHLFLKLNEMQTQLDAMKALFRTGPDTKEILYRACIGKKGYKSPEHAGQGASRVKASGSTDELRIYSCPFCGCYHLTKTTLEQIAGVG